VGQPEDTIVAVATAPGRGALDVVRLSGPRAAEICAAFIRPDPRGKPARHNFAARAIGVGGVLDRLTCTRFRAPSSYTGQDAVELCCHGGGAIARRLVELAVENGARPAEPGEFTRQAYEAGKVVLTISPLKHNWAVRFLSHEVYRDTDAFAAALASGQVADRVAEILGPRKRKAAPVAAN